MGKSKRTRDAAESDEKAFDWGIDIPAKKRKRDDDAAAEPDATNGEVKKSKKDKKEKKDKKDKKDKHQKESRKERKDKKKDLQDLPEQDEPMADEEEATPKVEEPEVKKEKKSKKERKAEKAALEAETPAAPAKEVNGDAAETKAEKKDKKKDKKSKKDKKDKSTESTAAEPSTNGTATETPDSSNPNAIALSPEDAQKADRHIVFVGNLPFTATAASITAHFASLDPIAVRCMKNKDDDKPCKGFAFVEFGKVWHMRTCLDKFHHSMFEDGVSAGRKINIELTAGGGGKTKQRQEKIRSKNEKLDENRAKRIENEKKAKKEGGGAAGGEDKGAAGNGGIHPSRLARLPGLGQ